LRVCDRTGCPHRALHGWRYTSGYPSHPHSADICSRVLSPALSQQFPGRAFVACRDSKGAPPACIEFGSIPTISSRRSGGDIALNTPHGYSQSTHCSTRLSYPAPSFTLARAPPTGPPASGFATLSPSGSCCHHISKTRVPSILSLCRVPERGCTFAVSPLLDIATRSPRFRMPASALGVFLPVCVENAASQRMPALLMNFCVAVHAAQSSISHRRSRALSHGAWVSTPD
jgi:hypothetical protein